VLAKKYVFLTATFSARLIAKSGGASGGFYAVDSPELQVWLERKLRLQLGRQAEAKGPGLCLQFAKALNSTSSRLWSVVEEISRLLGDDGSKSFSAASQELLSESGDGRARALLQEPFRGFGQLCFAQPYLGRLLGSRPILIVGYQGALAGLQKFAPATQRAGTSKCRFVTLAYCDGPEASPLADVGAWTNLLSATVVACVGDHTIGLLVEPLRSKVIEFQLRPGGSGDRVQNLPSARAGSGIPSKRGSKPHPAGQAKKYPKGRAGAARAKIDATEKYALALPALRILTITTCH